MTLTVSWTALRRYEECHQRQYRTMRGEITKQPFKRSYLPGSIVDLVEREWLNQIDPQPGGMAKIAPDVIDRLTNPDRNDEAFEPFSWKGNPREDRANITDFVFECIKVLEPVLQRLVLPHEFEPEVKFRTVIGVPYLDGQIVGIILRGGIDIVTRLAFDDLGHKKGDFVNYDLKATVNDSYIATTLGQGTFYDLSWHAFYGQRPSAFGFIAPALEQNLWWSNIDDDERRVMMERIIAMAHGMWRGDWDPKIDDEGCQYCEARHACPKYTQHLVTDAMGKRRINFDESLRARTAARGRGNDELGGTPERAAIEAGGSGAPPGSA